MMDSTRLASLLASRVFHDLVSPLTGMITGAELAFDHSMPAAVKVDGERLVQESLTRIEATIQFMRFAIGGQALSAMDSWADPHGAKALFDKLFAVQKSSLQWAVSTNYITNAQMRVLMNMALIMTDPAAKSGVVKVGAREEGGDIVFEVDAIGQPGEFKPEVAAALARKEPERGWGAGIQPLFTTMIAEEAGMKLETRQLDGGVGLVARGPKKAD
jgi:histidine phosphotransferase ChpT